MPLALYVDVHVPAAITEQLRRRGVDVLTALDDSAGELPDDELLLRARELGRVLFTQDIGFRALAEGWQRAGTPFNGLLFGHQLRGTIADYAADLEPIAKASSPDDWHGVVAYLPF